MVGYAAPTNADGHFPPLYSQSVAYVPSLLPARNVLGGLQGPLSSCPSPPPALKFSHRSDRMARC